MRSTILLSFLATLAPGCASAPTPSQTPAPARVLFVSDVGGVVHALGLEGGVPRTTLWTADLGEPLHFLALHPARPIVYALGDRDLHALAWDEDALELTALGRAPVGVRGTHVEVHPDGDRALVASYGGNAVVLLELGEAGEPGRVLHVLGGPDDAVFRRAHQVRVHAPSGAIHVPCLGADHVAHLALDAARTKLELRALAPTPEGAGPRHLDFHPTLPLAFALNELASSVTAFAIDADGALRPLGTTTTLPAGRTEFSRSSDVHVSPDGRWLFAVNREPLNDLVTFAIRADGALAPVGRVSTGGDHARTFAVDPAGGTLWVANTRSRAVTSFRVAEDGTLRATGEPWNGEHDLTCVLAR